MQSHPPRYMHEPPDPEEEAMKQVIPARRKRLRRNRTELADPVFDVTTWRLPGRWRKDKRVGDEAMSKMLHGIDPTRHEELAR